MCMQVKYFNRVSVSILRALMALGRLVVKWHNGSPFLFFSKVFSDCLMALTIIINASHILIRLGHLPFFPPILLYFIFILIPKVPYIPENKRKIKTPVCASGRPCDIFIRPRVSIVLVLLLLGKNIAGKWIKIITRIIIIIIIIRRKKNIACSVAARPRKLTGNPSTKDMYNTFHPKPHDAICRAACITSISTTEYNIHSLLHTCI